MHQPIIVYCRSGNRSESAMKLLKALGIKEVYNGGSVSDVKALLKQRGQRLDRFTVSSQIYGVDYTTVYVISLTSDF